MTIASGPAVRQCPPDRMRGEPASSASSHRRLETIRARRAASLGPVEALRAGTSLTTEEPMRFARPLTIVTEIQGKLDQLDERVVQDQRMVRATERWSSCLAAAGYHYTDPDAIDVD